MDASLRIGVGNKFLACRSTSLCSILQQNPKGFDSQQIMQFTIAFKRRVPIEPKENEVFLSKLFLMSKLKPIKFDSILINVILRLHASGGWESASEINFLACRSTSLCSILQQNPKGFDSYYFKRRVGIGFASKLLTHSLRNV